MQSVTEIQLNKLRAHFRARFAPMILANCAPLNVWGGGDYYIGANQAGKRARSQLHTEMINVSGWNLAADEEEDNDSEPPAKIPAVGLMISPPQQWIIFSEIDFSFLKVSVNSSCKCWR